MTPESGERLYSFSTGVCPGDHVVRRVHGIPTAPVLRPTHCICGSKVTHAEVVRYTPYCPRCGGSGYRRIPHPLRPHVTMAQEPCYICNPKGTDRPATVVVVKP